MALPTRLTETLGIEHPVMVEEIAFVRGAAEAPFGVDLRTAMLGDIVSDVVARAEEILGRISRPVAV